ncbi:hypothetical protein T439DRAFT_329787 [Meredithblackwellia eburnea MCA 4105]
MFHRICSFLTLLGIALAARETLDEAAVHARELIAYRAYNIGTLASTYKTNDQGLQGMALPLQEYYAEWPLDDSGDLLLLAMGISQIYRSALPPHESNMTITISDLYGLGDGNLAAGRMRVALFGNLEPVTHEEVEVCKKAYLAAHPDSRGWLPPNGPHFGFYARFRVYKVYAFDGFGDVAYIGWIPLDLYRLSGKIMRSKKEVLKHWPVPIQPEDPNTGTLEYLFMEQFGRQEEDTVKEARLKVQL